MNESKFYGVLPALATPLNGDNRTVNTEVVKDIIEYHLSCGANGFYVLGGTGEGLIMEPEQRRIMCEASIKAVGGRKPVIVHIAAMNFNECIELAKHAECSGADAIASVPPSFFSMTTKICTGITKNWHQQSISRLLYIIIRLPRRQ